MKFGIFKDEAATDNFMSIARLLDNYYVATGFETEAGLPRYITVHDSVITVSEKGRVEFGWGSFAGRSELMENVLGIYRHAPTGSKNKFKLAVDYEGKVMSGKALPRGKSYVFIPKLSRLYVCEHKQRGLRLDTRTGEITDEHDARYWKTYDVVSFEYI